MRLLIVTFSFAPATNPRALRWTALVDHWVRLGHTVDVVCAWTPGAARRETFKGLTVHRVGGGLIERLRALLTRERAAVESRGDTRTRVAPASSARWLRRLAKWVHDRTWKQVYWPDYALPWYFPAWRRARTCLAEQQYDATISVSLPFTAHLVGLRVKSRVPSLPWLVDAGDPFCFMDDTPTNNRALYGWLNARTERCVFEKADAVSVTTDGTRDRYAALFPGTASKIAVIPPLLSRQPEPIGPPLFTGRDKIRLAFVGTLYRAIRSPVVLLNLFDELTQEPGGEVLELHFFGQLHDCEEIFMRHRLQLNHTIFLHGAVAPAVARQAIREADILVNIGNATSYQLPSKIVEYASTGKRILNLTTHVDDASAGFLQSYSRALTLCASDMNVSARGRLADFVAAKITKEDEVQLARVWEQRFGVDRIAPQYESLLTDHRVTAAEDTEMLRPDARTARQ